MYPNRERGCDGMGTSCATGLPCLVITTGCPVRATSSINFRHSALKTAAGISIRLSHMTTIYGHYMADRNRRKSSSATGFDLCCTVFLLQGADQPDVSIKPFETIR